MAWLIERVDFELLRRLQAKPEEKKLEDEQAVQRAIDSLRGRIKQGVANFLDLEDPELKAVANDRLKSLRDDLTAAEARLSMIQTTRQGGDLASFQDWWATVKNQLVTIMVETGPETGNFFYSDRIILR